MLILTRTAGTAPVNQIVVNGRITLTVVELTPGWALVENTHTQDRHLLKIGQVVEMCPSVKMVYMGCKAGQGRFGFNAPKQVHILRAELQKQEAA